MTIAIEDTKEIFAGNDSATAFAFDFKTNAAADLRVVLTDATGVELDLAINVDYTVALNANQNTTPGGTVTYPITGSPLATGEKLTVVRDAALTQPTSFFLGVYPATLEAKLDNLTMFVQQLAEKAKRALRIGVSDADVPTLNIGTAATRANKIPTFDSNGDVELVASIVPGSFTQTTFNSFLAAISDAVRAAFFAAITVGSAAGTALLNIVAQLLNPRTAAEIAASVTPANYAKPEGDAPRYNLSLDGTTNDYTEFNKILNVGVPIYLRGKSIRLSGTFAQNDIRINGPGTIYTDLLKVTGDRWKVSDVDFIVDNDATISTTYSTSSGLGGVCLAGDDNHLDHCEISRAGTPSGYTSTQICNLLMGIDIDIGEFISQSHAPSGHGNRVTNSAIHSGVAGAYLGGKDAVIADCDLYSLATPIRLGASARGFNIDRNHLHDFDGTGASGHDGILASRNCGRGSITRNTIDGATEHGMYFQGWGTKITRNTVINCEHDGIKVSGHGDFLYWYAEENGGSGPDLGHPLGATTYMGHDVIVAHNTCIGNGQSGTTNADIFLQANADSGLREIIVQGNTCRDTAGYAIRTSFADGDNDSYIYDVSVIDNKCNNHTQANSILVGGHEDIRIERNVVDGNIQSDAVSADAADLTKRLVLRGNKCGGITAFRAEAGWVADHNHVSGSIAGVTSGAGTIRRNVGYVTENSGTSSIASGTTSIAVTHGLAITPDATKIIVNFTEQGTNDYGRFWISNITSTQFTVNVSADPGASNLDFSWRVVS